MISAFIACKCIATIRLSLFHPLDHLSPFSLSLSLSLSLSHFSLLLTLSLSHFLSLSLSLSDALCSTCSPSETLINQSSDVSWSSRYQPRPHRYLCVCVCV